MKREESGVGLWNNKKDKIELYPKWKRVIFWIAIFVIFLYGASYFLPESVNPNIFHEVKVMVIEKISRYF
jgi:hypothetical protein